MSKRRREIVKWMAVISIVIILFVVLHNVLPYKCDYFRTLDVYKYGSMNKNIDYMGEPNKIENVSEEYLSWCWWMVYYDGLILYYGTESGLDLFRVDITGSQYKFGWRKVHVGMTRSEIEKIYKNNEQIKDCDKNEFGVIQDDFCWIYFKFDEDDILQMITITDGL